MSATFRLQADADLGRRNTFGVLARAPWLLEVDDNAVLAQALDLPQLRDLPLLVLGGGSNLVLTGDFDGLVVHMAVLSIAVHSSGSLRIWRAMNSSTRIMPSDPSGPGLSCFSTGRRCIQYAAMAASYALVRAKAARARSSRSFLVVAPRFAARSASTRAFSPRIARSFLRPPACSFAIAAKSPTSSQSKSPGTTASLPAFAAGSATE